MAALQPAGIEQPELNPLNQATPNMSIDYSLVLQAEKNRTLSFISVLLSVIAIAFSLLFASNEQWRWLRLAPALAVGVGLVWNLIVRFTRLPPIPYAVHLVIGSMAWLFKPGLYWIGVLYLLMAVLERKTRKPVIIRFSAKEIEYDALYKRQFQWKELNNAVLKDGMLTLDFRNNKIIQKDVLEAGIDETAFNQYCRGRID